MEYDAENAPGLFQGIPGKAVYARRSRDPDRIHPLSSRGAVIRPLIRIFRRMDLSVTLPVVPSSPSEKKAAQPVPYALSEQPREVLHHFFLFRNFHSTRTSVTRPTPPRISQSARGSESPVLGIMRFMMVPPLYRRSFTSSYAPTLT